MGLPLAWTTLNFVHLFWLAYASSEAPRPGFIARGSSTTIPARICGDDCIALMDRA
jgi:hypothetical protein